MDICKITVIGHVQPRDPETRFTPDGQPLTQFRLVSNRNKKNAAGEWESIGEWFQVTTFGRLAETAAKILHKGAHVYVEGRLSSRVWTDNDGKERTSLEIVATELVMLGQRASGNTEPATHQAPGASSTRSHVDDNDLDNLPF